VSYKALCFFLLQGEIILLSFLTDFQFNFKVVWMAKKGVNKALILAAGPRITLAFAFRYYSYTAHAAVLTGRADSQTGGEL